MNVELFKLLIVKKCKNDFCAIYIQNISLSNNEICKIKQIVNCFGQFYLLLFHATLC